MKHNQSPFLYYITQFGKCQAPFEKKLENQ